MPYDPKLDEQIFAKSHETETDRITVSVYSYNKGQKKVQISREGKNADGEYKFAKLGRLTKDEAEAIIPLIQEAVGKIG
ncbi:MAG: hypothetical protein PHT95_06770 [Candidatus Omnitrophica bacterium]|nr:hypothetical protein [Candidatus Omnitrophota bacterium]MDD4013519.1 hypothetical protein [Candidatus Omnitrophota bacterium]